MTRCLLMSVLLGAFLISAQAFAERETLCLDGRWEIAESVGAEEIPAVFGHTVQVPGLVNQAKPGFVDVDAFQSREHLANRIRSGLVPAEWLTNYWKGKVNQSRNYFWYRRSFRAPAERGAATLRVNKAQFGTAVWLNGVPVGEYPGCFSAGVFDLKPAMRWRGENTLLIRIGAHPAVLPDDFPTGSDFEKIQWTPGIYDRVTVLWSDAPVIESVQVAPRITGEIVVQTTLRNPSAEAVTSPVEQQVRPWKGRAPGATAEPQIVILQPGQSLTITQQLVIPEARLWSPERPFLYVVETRTKGDDARTRFGVREFTFDPATRRAWLNGQPYFLRGSNITLHRFFEDPLCRDLPWREAWVRRLLGRIPKEMNWNYFRFCIGPVPDAWLEICDEVGLLVQNEFFVWTGGEGWYRGYSRRHNPEEMIRQYRDWMRDNWNHPSVVVWDANNETKDAMFGERIIPAVRPLDLSNRPWENSYNPPVAAHDPVEDHPYLMISGGSGKLDFAMTRLETMDGKPRKGSLPSDRHVPLINEYGWLWLNRDGTPTSLTEKLYPQLMGTTNVTARERLDLYAYLLAAKTEFWRAHRAYAGIIHFVYLTCSYPGVYTADHFQDVTRLKLDPAFADYVGQAFRPLGVYLNFFQPRLAPGSRTFRVFLVNDHAEARRGTVTLSLEGPTGKVVASVSKPFTMEALGDMTLDMPLEAPAGITGKCVLKATAQPEGKEKPTVSRRWVEM